MSINSSGVTLGAGFNPVSALPGNSNVSSVGLCVSSTKSPAALIYGIANAAGSTTIGTPAANSALRQCHLSVSEDATMTAAGINTITLALNGVTFYVARVWVPATALATNGELWAKTLEFENFLFLTGASGTLTANLSTALATGDLNVNAYFG